jgi:hypothetical protein
VRIPASRATSESWLQRRRNDPSFSARDHRRRRCTDVITSTCVLVIGLALGLVPGLTSREVSAPGKVAVTGGILSIEKNSYTTASIRKSTSPTYPGYSFSPALAPDPL